MRYDLHSQHAENLTGARWASEAGRILPTMTDMNAEILRELKEISFLLGDLNAIRNGEYDPPSGSGSSGRANGSQATPNALLKALNRIADSLDNEAERADERHAELIEVLAAIDESGLKRHTELVGVVEDLGTSLALN